VEKNESTKGDESIMVFGEPFYDDHLVRNPNDFSYQLGPSTILDNIKFELQKTVETGAQNIQAALDNIVQTVRENYENYKQNINEYNNQYGNQEPFFKLDLNPPITQNNIIHEELAEKERRIRQLESTQLEDRKDIEDLKKELKELKNNPFLKWMPKAVEDSKKEKIF